LGLFKKVKDRFSKVQREHKEKEEERAFQQHIEAEAYKENYAKKGREEARRRGLKRAVSDARRDIDRHTPGFKAVGGFLFAEGNAQRRESAANDILSGVGGSDSFIYGSRKKGKEDDLIW
jgi:hypothetical protein